MAATEEQRCGFGFYFRKEFLIKSMGYSFENWNNGNEFFLIAGPCVVEGEEMTTRIAARLAELTLNMEIPFIFKASFRKANRSRSDSFQGIGDVKALEILAGIRSTYNIPVITDVHSVEDVTMASDFVDVLQIPAFLCRQTELLVAAGKSGRVVNIKKGQFLSPESMEYAVEKVRNAGGQIVWQTERGTTFGYQDLVVDFRGIPVMKGFSPVIMDCTHSVQQPNQTSGVTGGRPDMIETIARAAIAVGVDGLFIETHPEPAKALSDGANMLHLDLMPSLLARLQLMRKAYIEMKNIE